MTNEETILEMVSRNQELLQKTYKSAEKTRKYLLYTAIITILMIILPVIGLLLIIPQFLQTYSDMTEGML
jgi:type II secretory pathway component PulF